MLARADEMHWLESQETTTWADVSLRLHRFVHPRYVLKLAPWITTKNFLQATQAKAMLRLHGEGDPTGRGEAFSFIRVSMKDIFVRAGEDYEAKLGECG